MRTYLSYGFFIFLYVSVGVLTCISEELDNAPFYYQLPDLASRLHSKVPTTIEFQSALINAGKKLVECYGI